MKRAIFIISGGFFALILVVLLIVRSNPGVRQLSQAEFIALARSNLLVRIRVYYPPKPGQVDGVAVMLNEVRGTFYESDARGQPATGQRIPRECPFIARVQITDELMVKLTRTTNFAVVSPNPVVQQATELLHLTKP
jgi:hypothetical protein